MAKQHVTAVPPVTFSPEALEQIIRSNPDVLARVLKSVKDTGDADKADQAVVRAFEKRGFKGIVLFDRNKPLADQAGTVTVLTYKKWGELGFVVKKGEKSIKAKGCAFHLFHRSQVEPASASKLPPVTLIEPKPVKARKPKSKAKGNVVPLQPSI